MGLSIDGMIENIEIVDVFVYTEKLYYCDELTGVDIKFIYKYMIGDKLTGEEEVLTEDINEAKEHIARALLERVDELGMYA